MFEYINNLYTMPDDRSGEKNNNICPFLKIRIFQRSGLKDICVGASDGYTIVALRANIVSEGRFVDPNSTFYLKKRLDGKLFFSTELEKDKKILLFVKNKEIIFSDTYHEEAHICQLSFKEFCDFHKGYTNFLRVCDDTQQSPSLEQNTQMISPEKRKFSFIDFFQSLFGDKKENTKGKNIWEE